MKLIDLPEIQDLSVFEKLELLDELWLSVTQDLESIDVSDEERELLDTRWAAFLKDPAASALTVDLFREKLRTLRA